MITGAIGLIEGFGWIQYHLGGYRTGFCMVGALNESARLQVVTSGNRVDALEEALTFVKRETGCWSIVRFNDSAYMSRNRALAVLSHAAEAARLRA